MASKQGEQVVTAGKVALREGSAVQVIGDCRQGRPPQPAQAAKMRSAGASMTSPEPAGGHDRTWPRPSGFNLVEFATRRRVTIAM